MRLLANLQGAYDHTQDYAVKFDIQHRQVSPEMSWCWCSNTICWLSCMIASLDTGMRQNQMKPSCKKASKSFLNTSTTTSQVNLASQNKLQMTDVVITQCHTQEFALLAPACRLSPVEAAGDYDTSASSGFVVLVVCLYCFWASTSVGCPRHVAQAVLCETAETPA